MRPAAQLPPPHAPCGVRRRFVSPPHSPISDLGNTPGCRRRRRACGANDDFSFFYYVYFS